MRNVLRYADIVLILAGLALTIVSAALGGEAITLRAAAVALFTGVSVRVVSQLTKV